MPKMIEHKYYAYTGRKTETEIVLTVTTVGEFGQSVSGSIQKELRVPIEFLNLLPKLKIGETLTITKERVEP